MVISISYLVGLVLCGFLLARLSKERYSVFGKYLLIMSLLTSFWLFAEGASYFFSNESYIIFLQKAKYISIITIGPTLFLFAITLTFGAARVKPWSVIAVFILPLLSLTSLATNVVPYAFISSPKAYFENGFLHFVYTREIGFYIHMVYAYSTILISNFIFAYKYIKSPKLYKTQSLIIAAGSIVPACLNVYFIIGGFAQIQFDTTPVSILVSLFAYYWGIYLIPSNRLLAEARALVVEDLTDIIIILDNQKNVVDMNAKAKAIINEAVDEKIKNKIITTSELNIPLEKILNCFPISKDEIAHLLKEHSGEVSIKLNQQQFYYNYFTQWILDEHKKSIGELLVLKDITESRNYVNRLLQINKSLIVSHAIIKNAREAIVVLDENAEIISVNRSMIEISGYTEEELVGNSYSTLRSDQHDVIFYKKIWDSVTSKGYWEGELWDQRKNGEVYPKWMSFIRIIDERNETQHYVIISSDRSKLKKAETDLKYLAYYDGLTGLPNRTLFMDRLQIAISKAKRNGTKIALFFIDMDRFKLVNDSLGHSVGDELLVAIAEKISSLIKKDDTLSRLGGDEFTLILENLSDDCEAEKVAEDIIRAFKKPVKLRNLELNVMLSIGIAIGPEEDETEESFISRADIAMYQSKESRDKKYSYISKEILEKRKRLQQINIDLDKAVLDGEFKLFLQPQIKLIDNIPTLVGAEALIRWFKSDGKVIQPNEFIQVAEANGIIHEIGYWVFEEILRLNKILRDKGIAIDLSINVSVIQFERSDFISRITELIKANTIPLSLTVEITESLFFSNLEKGIINLKALKELDLHIAMDDFGTGFSSLSYLNQLPIDYLKIDKSFIDEIECDGDNGMAHMILYMAEILKLKTVAEGIETEIQAKSMIDAGCSILQGYLYGRPMDLESFISYALNYEK